MVSDERDWKPKQHKTIFGSILGPKRDAKVFKKRSIKRHRKRLEEESENISNIGPTWLPKATPKNVFFGTRGFIDF